MRDDVHDRRLQEARSLNASGVAIGASVRAPSLNNSQLILVNADRRAEKIGGAHGSIEEAAFQKLNRPNLMKTTAIAKRENNLRHEIHISSSGEEDEENDFDMDELLDREGKHELEEQDQASRLRHDDLDANSYQEDEHLSLEARDVLEEDIHNQIELLSQL